MRPKTDGKACKAIPAFPRGQSRYQEDLTLSPYAFEKPGTSVAVNSQPRRAFSAKSALRGEAKAIRRRAELADGMSEAVKMLWGDLRGCCIVTTCDIATGSAHSLRRCSNRDAPRARHRVAAAPVGAERPADRDCEDFKTLTARPRRAPAPASRAVRFSTPCRCCSWAGTRRSGSRAGA